MDTLERDAAYIAEQVKLARRMHKLTQENLADMAGLSTRTIEKIESGRHVPEEQTLRSLARALNLEVSFFNKPNAEDEARTRADIDAMMDRTAVVSLKPVHTANDFLTAFGAGEMLQVDTSGVTDDAALDVAAEIADWLRDMGDIWEDLYMGARVDAAREFIGICDRLAELGYAVLMGSFRQVQRGHPKPLVFGVFTVTILPTERAATLRFGLVELQPGWRPLHA